MSGLIRCAACGVPMGPAGLPPSPAQIEHIATCEKHPMAALRADNDRLREALRGLVTAASLIEWYWQGCPEHDDVRDKYPCCPLCAARPDEYPREEWSGHHQTDCTFGAALRRARAVEEKR